MKDDISFAKLLRLRNEKPMLYMLSVVLIRANLSTIASKWLHH
ncbi:MAG: hypothetical protein AB1454_09060 [Candidatus Auribacterota bacterium]